MNEQLKKEVSKKKNFVSIIDYMNENYESRELMEVLSSILTKSQRETITEYINKECKNELMRACEWEGLAEYDGSNYEWKILV